jgi:hypothetical protein
VVEPPVRPLPLASATGVASLPGLRTLRSARFRTVLAATLLAIGVSVLGLALLRQAGDPQGQFAIDFSDYHVAAQRLASGASPYAPEMLTGPTDAQGIDRYRYPPPFAQLLVALAGLPLGAAATIWLIAQGAAIVAAAWFAAMAGGARRSLETALWCAVSATLFLPVFDTLWKGNVSGIVALGVAIALIGGAAGGVAVALVSLLKLVPATLAASLATDRRGSAAAMAAAAVVVAVSVALAPRAWADYVVVLPNLLAGSADQVTNLAPWAIVDHAGWPALAAAVRAGSVAISVGCALAAVLAARRPHGRAAAVALGTASMLLLPAALWFHYLAVLLPLAAFAWPSAGARTRIALLASMVLVTFGVALLPLATVGATVASASVIWVVRPRGPGHPPDPV